MGLDWNDAVSLARSAAGELRKQRWFTGKARTVSGSELVDFGEVGFESGSYLLAIIRMMFEGEGSMDYFVPLALSGEEPSGGGPLSTKLELDGRMVHITDALHDGRFIRWLLHLLATGGSMAMKRGRIHADRTPLPGGVLSPAAAISIISSEQSNTSAVADSRVIYKSYRRVENGTNPDCEVPRALASTGFQAVPRPLGTIEYSDDGTYTLGSLSEFVANEGDCWTYFLRQLREYFRAIGGRGADRSRGEAASCISVVRALGALTSSLHNTLSNPSSDPAFDPIAISRTDIDAWISDYGMLMDDALRSLSRSLPGMSRSDAALAESLIAGEGKLRASGERVKWLGGGEIHRIRTHGDYHLGQVLKSGDRFYIIDFEGEPMRPLGYRRAPHCALRDVSGMLRSLDYAASYTAMEISATGAHEIAESWCLEAQQQFLHAYWSSYKPARRYLPGSFDAMNRAAGFFTIEKAVYELNYELNNRPGWISIPLRAILRITSGDSAQTINNEHI